MRIEVTQQHIDSGKYGCKLCPIALALRELYPNKDITVSNTSASIGDGIANLPQVARDFIVQFDRNKNVFPFVFEIKE